jgi:hypothetical protein
MGRTSLSLKYAAICSVAADVTSNMISSLKNIGAARYRQPLAVGPCKAELPNAGPRAGMRVDFPS